MKVFFSIMLIFLFLSCSNNITNVADDLETIDSDTESGKSGEDIVSDTDEEDSGSDADEEVLPDADEEVLPDADEDTGIVSDPCETEPCKNAEFSTGECIPSETDYICGCRKYYSWDYSEKRCAADPVFKGTVCTGQKRCYNMKKEISCPEKGMPFYGQDAQYAEMGKCIPRSYTIKQYDTGETVIDNNLGLEWQRGSFFSGNFSLSGAYYYCANLENGGGGWRLPSIDEQYTMVDSEYFQPAVDRFYFPETSPVFFFSNYSETMIGFDPQFYYFGGLNFEYGELQVNSASTSDSQGNYYGASGTKCVRNPAERRSCMSDYMMVGEYNVNFDVTKNLFITDIADGEKNWFQALDYCANMNYAGISEWRVPNRNEIRSRFALQAGSDYYWTSTTAAHNPAYAGTLSPHFPMNIVFNPKENLYKVFCVASNPCGEKEVWTGDKCTPFYDLGLDDVGCQCRDLYSFSSSKKQCIERCNADLCKTVEHATGECGFAYEGSSTYRCQCEEGYFYNLENDELGSYEGDKCVNPCSEEPCMGMEGSDEICTALSYRTYSCGCMKDYYFSKAEKKCLVFSPVCKVYDSSNGNYKSPCRDEISKLMWAEYDSLNASRLEWEKAKEYCEDKSFGGYSDWRLPTVDELRTLESDCENIKPDGKCRVSEKAGCLSENCVSDCRCSESGSATITQEGFWSSSLVSDNPNEAFVMGYNGSIGFADIGKRNIVRCVRNFE